MKIKLTQRIDDKKLHCVKAIKFNTNYGLKESKDIFDWMNSHVGQFTNIEMTKDQIKNFKKELLLGQVTEFQFIFEDRDLNLLKLGIGEKDDYIETIAEFMSGSDIETIKNILVMLNKDTLIQLCEKITL